jgi:hypothetical protein
MAPRRPFAPEILKKGKKQSSTATGGLSRRNRERFPRGNVTRCAIPSLRGQLLARSASNRRLRFEDALVRPIDIRPIATAAPRALPMGGRGRTGAAAARRPYAGQCGQGITCVALDTCRNAIVIHSGHIERGTRLRLLLFRKRPSSPHRGTVPAHRAGSPDRA